MVVFIFSASLYAAEPKKAQTPNVWQGSEISADQSEGIRDIPCFMSDMDKDFFACTGIHQGRKNQNKEEVKAFALAEAVDTCSMKLKHEIISGSYCVDPASFLAISNTAQISCVKYSVEKGIVTAYVGIKVPKKELSQKVKELEKIGMYPEKKPTNVKSEKKVPDYGSITEEEKHMIDEAIGEEEKQMIEMIEKRLKEAEEKDKTEQRKKK